MACKIPIGSETEALEGGGRDEVGGGVGDGGEDGLGGIDEGAAEGADLGGGVVVPDGDGAALCAGGHGGVWARGGPTRRRVTSVKIILFK